LLRPLRTMFHEDLAVSGNSKVDWLTAVSLGVGAITVGTEDLLVFEGIDSGEI
jgi:hypothetical protein